MATSTKIIKAEEKLRELAQYSYKNMRLIHSPPYRSIYAGGAGIAYTFWRAACLLDEPEWLHHARFWIDHVVEAAEDNPTIQLLGMPEKVITLQIKDSFYWGNPGVSCVRALIAHAEDNQPHFRRALKSFLISESEGLITQELLDGIAGRLIGCTLLYRETGDERVKEYGDSMAQELLRTADASQDRLPWQSNTKLGMAHGRAGNYYGLLSWTKETEYVLPDWVLIGLREYARSGRHLDRGISWPIEEADEEKYMNSWCNGAPGLMLLWNLAYTLYGDPLFLETAKATAEYIRSEPDLSLGHICCGAAGPAYAFLSLHRVDPGGPWLQHANHQFEVALKGIPDKFARLSLYRGLAGIICLMLDMNNPEEAAFPALE